MCVVIVGCLLVGEGCVYVELECGYSLRVLNGGYQGFVKKFVYIEE